MKTKNLMMGCVVGALMVGTAAWAGLKSTFYVTVNSTSRYAFGSVGDARGSADTQQYIGCAVDAFSNTGSTYVFCDARNASGVIGYCMSTSPAMLAAVATQSSSSYYYFGWDADGNCTYLSISNWSDLAPRQP